jgi:hypothetical protein
MCARKHLQMFSDRDGGLLLGRRGPADYDGNGDSDDFELALLAKALCTNSVPRAVYRRQLGHRACYRTGLGAWFGHLVRRLWRVGSEWLPSWYYGAAVTAWDIAAKTVTQPLAPEATRRRTRVSPTEEYQEWWPSVADHGIC